jgi:hypothetical protein
MDYQPQPVPYRFSYRARGAREYAFWRYHLDTPEWAPYYRYRGRWLRRARDEFWEDGMFHHFGLKLARDEIPSNHLHRLPPQALAEAREMLGLAPGFCDLPEADRRIPIGDMLPGMPANGFYTLPALVI